MTQKVTSEQIKRAVCEYYGQTMDIFYIQNREGHVIKSKHIAIYLATKYMSNNGLKKIAILFRLTNHTSVLHAKNKIKGWLEYDKELIKDVNEIEERIKSFICIDKYTINMYLLGRSIN